jgi:hypothetical protein
MDSLIVSPCAQRNVLRQSRGVCWKACLTQPSICDVGTHDGQPEVREKVPLIAVDRRRTIEPYPGKSSFRSVRGSIHREINQVAETTTVVPC